MTNNGNIMGFCNVIKRLETLGEWMFYDDLEWFIVVGFIVLSYPTLLLTSVLFHVSHLNKHVNKHFPSCQRKLPQQAIT